MVWFEPVPAAGPAVVKQVEAGPVNVQLNGVPAGAIAPTAPVTVAR